MKDYFGRNMKMSLCWLLPTPSTVSLWLMTIHVPRQTDLQQETGQKAAFNLLYHIFRSTVRDPVWTRDHLRHLYTSWQQSPQRCSHYTDWRTNTLNRGLGLLLQQRHFQQKWKATVSSLTPWNSRVTLMLIAAFHCNLAKDLCILPLLTVW